jgi:hypothetical protein
LTLAVAATNHASTARAELAVQTDKSAHAAARFAPQYSRQRNPTIEFSI